MSSISIQTTTKLYYATLDFVMVHVMFHIAKLLKYWIFNNFFKKANVPKTNSLALLHQLCAPKLVLIEWKYQAKCSIKLISRTVFQNVLHSYYLISQWLIFLNIVFFSCRNPGTGSLLITYTVISEIMSEDNKYIYYLFMWAKTLNFLFYFVYYFIL